MNQEESRIFEKEWRSIEPKLAGFFFRKGCPQQDIDDLVQETVIRSWTNFPLVKSDLNSWVWGIARLVYLEYLKKRRGEAGFTEGTEIVDIDPNSSYETISKSTMSKSLQELDPIDRKCLILHDSGGKNFSEISKMLGISSSNVHYHVDRARTILRESFPEPELKEKSR